MKHFLAIIISILLFLPLSCATNIQSKHDKAIEDYSKSIDMNPNNAEAYGNRGLAYYNKGQYDRAIEDYNKAIALNPNLAWNYNNRGLIYGIKGQYDRAIEDFNKAIAINPNDADAYRNRGRAYYDKGFMEKAMADFQKACDLGEEVGCKAISLANSEKILKENSKAVVSILKYNKSGNLIGRGSGFIVRQDGVIITNYHVITNAADIRVRIKDDTFRVQGLLHIDKENDIVVLKAEAKDLAILKLGDSENTIVGEKVYAISNPDGNRNIISDGIFRAIREIPPKKKVLMTTANVSRGSSGGTLLNKNGEVIGIITFAFGTEGAVAMPVNLIKDKILSKIVISLKDAKIEDNTNYYYLVNSCSYADDDSIEPCTKALAINSNNAMLYYNRGVAYGRKGQHDRAIEDYNKAVIINPNFLEAYNNRGVAYESKGQYDRAIEDYNRALGIDSNDAKAYYNRGIAYGKKGQGDRAIDDFNSAIAIDPYEVAIYSDRGLLYILKGQFDKAIEDFNKVIVRYPTSVKAYSGRGLAFSGKGRYDQAIEDSNKAIIINPNYAYAYVVRGYAYLMKGLTNNAISDFRKSCDIGSEEGCKSLQQALKNK